MQFEKTNSVLVETVVPSNVAPIRIECENASDETGNATGGTGNWNKVSRKKPRKNRKRGKKNKPIIGNDQSAPNFVANPLKELHAAGFRVETTESAVVNYISSKLAISNGQISCMKLVKPTADLTKLRFINFKISLPEEIFARALDPLNWPSGIRVKRFIPKNGVALPAVETIT